MATDGKQNLARKLIADHLIDGEMTPGADIALRIDQTLTCVFALRVSHASPTSCCGSSPMLNSGLPRYCGQISTRRFWTLPSPITR